MIKALIIFIVISPFCLPLHAQADVHGWEFLHWYMPKDSVALMLEKNKAVLKDPNALDADFKYHDMNTWLLYDSTGRLNAVKQRADFSVNRDEEAKEFYDVTVGRLTATYGRPAKKEVNRKDCVIDLAWDLKITKLLLHYDYKYKIIDEFGAGSYWVELIYTPE